MGGDVGGCDFQVSVCLLFFDIFDGDGDVYEILGCMRWFCQGKGFLVLRYFVLVCGGILVWCGVIVYCVVVVIFVGYCLLYEFGVQVFVGECFGCW